MLIRFNVKNLLSFDETQEFSMIAGSARSHQTHIDKSEKLKLLKFAAVFGANASGKSNLVLALDFVRGSLIHEIPYNCYQSYCRIKPENQNIPSEFEFEIKIGSEIYAYGFDIQLNKRSIVGEWLYRLYPNGKEEEIFTRKPKEEFQHFSDKFSDNARSTLETYGRDLLTNDTTLFLSEMNRNKNDLYTREKELLPLKKVYLWFKENLIVNYPGSELIPASFFQDEDLPEFNKIIVSMGLGINRVEFVESTLEEVQKKLGPFSKEVTANIERNIDFARKKGENKLSLIIRTLRNLFRITYNLKDLESQPEVKKLTFEQSRNHVRFEMEEESDGTRRLVDLIEIILAAKAGVEKTYVIDEINRCLHPQVTYRYISEYLDSLENSKTQLIVTTHESHLMDLNLLRRDEIWFVDKNDAGESHLYSLEEYNTRFDQRVRRAYLEGRYGGVPLFDKYFPIKKESA